MNSKERFTNRVQDYSKYRPSYPIEAIDFLYEQVGLTSEGVIADIGAGTGIFSELLLARGSQVIAVEPNDAMREAAAIRLANRQGFKAIPGSAEDTGLPEHSVDAVVCAQSFHWFKQAEARHEFGRIIRPDGATVLIWNSRKTSGSPFLEAYERLLLTFAKDYDKVGHKFITPDTLRTFFQSSTMQLERFPMHQTFDFDGLKGRLQSSSYSPLPGHPQYEAMIAELYAMFERYERNGVVQLEYETEVYTGKV